MTEKTNVTEIDIMQQAVAMWCASLSVPDNRLSFSYFVQLLRDHFPAQTDAPDLRPAVEVANSVQNDHIVCLEDGAKVKLLKRHLNKLGISLEDYRKKWNLPLDYPTVPPAYAEKRSILAKKTGLGHKNSSDAFGLPPITPRNKY